MSHGRQLWGRQSAAECASRSRPRNTLATRQRGTARPAFLIPLRVGWAGDGEEESVPARDTGTRFSGSQQGRKAADSNPRSSMLEEKLAWKTFRICLERVTSLKNTLLIYVGIPCVASSCQLLKFPDRALDFILPVKWLDVAIVSFIPRRK